MRTPAGRRRSRWRTSNPLCVDPGRFVSIRHAPLPLRQTSRYGAVQVVHLAGVLVVHVVHGTGSVRTLLAELLNARGDAAWRRWPRRFSCIFARFVDEPAEVVLLGLCPDIAQSRAGAHQDAEAPRTYPPQASSSASRALVARPCGRAPLRGRRRRLPARAVLHDGIATRRREPAQPAYGGRTAGAESAEHAARRSALQQFAGEVAHAINNPAPGDPQLPARAGRRSPRRSSMDGDAAAERGAHSISAVGTAARLRRRQSRRHAGTGRGRTAAVASGAARRSA